MKKIILGLLMIFVGLFIVLYSCIKNKKITPVQFPDVAIQNFKFPNLVGPVPTIGVAPMNYVICTQGIFPSRS